MKRFIHVGALALGIAAASQAAWAADTHWEYQGHEGPAHWGDLDPAFSACQLGKEQSPIDISATEKAKLAPLQFDYRSSTATLWNNGHTIQLNYDKGSFITIDEDKYELVQFHFHSPAEEKVNGKPFSMVAHLVHKNVEGKLAVVAVLLEEDKQENIFLKSFWDQLPKKKAAPLVLENKTINIVELLPTNRAYYTFNGSLTTPPCSEGVRWFVLKQPVQLSKQQHAAFKAIHPNNARPIQALNGRIVREGI